MRNETQTMETIMYISFGSGHCEINIKYDDAANCSHSGSCDHDVRYLAGERYIKKQTDKIDPALLRRELKEYGAWNEIELLDHRQNIMRMLWIFCNDIMEQFSRSGKRKA